MVIVGGATRLTDSGLSITEWKPLLGAIPPLNEAHWLEAFEKYKLIPEYQIQNRGMSLAEFKFIYWWEWAHRFLGRFIGVAFIVPLVYFVVTRSVERRLWPRLFVLFVLGGLQGALGWFMVASGLSERVDVSQYRLAAHLTFAVLLFAAIVWTALGLKHQRHWQGSTESRMALLLLGMLFLQVAAGGFVAGLDAGHAADTWPKMNGSWLPDGLWVMQPAWRNIFENALAVQFNHRMVAYAIFAFAVWLAFKSGRPTAWAIVAALLLQVLLGIFTVIWAVPLSVALMHQGGALCVIALTLVHLHGVLVKPSPDQDRR
jgi:cytochrome c oxidase assembly protein subunit 15